MDTNVACSHLASCQTRFIGAKLMKRVHWLCCAFHHSQHASRCLLFQALLTFSPLSDIVGELVNQAQTRDMLFSPTSSFFDFANNILVEGYRLSLNREHFYPFFTYLLHVLSSSRRLSFSYRIILSLIYRNIRGFCCDIV